MKNLWYQNKNARNPMFLCVDGSRYLDGQSVDGWGYDTGEHFTAVGIVQELGNGIERIVHAIVEDGKVLTSEEKEAIFQKAESAMLSEE